MITIQYGLLTEAQQATFLADQAALIRSPGFAVRIDGIGDVGEYVESIDTHVGIEAHGKRGTIGIGKAVVRASNEGDTFYSDGAPTTSDNARINIWGGFGTLLIPIFAGIVKTISPMARSDRVEITCHDNMGLFLDPRVRGSQGSNTTVKTIIESFCSDMGIVDNIPSNAELTATLSKNSLEPQTTLNALRRLCDSTFHVVWCDELGTLQMAEREYTNITTWKYHNRNIFDAYPLADTEVINKVDVEYRENYLARYKDQVSIDTYRLRERNLRLMFQNYEDVASKTTGATPEDIDNNLEGFKFTSSSGAANIDCVAVKLKGTGASGAILLKIYSDSAGSPSALLGTSDTEYANDLASFGSAWHYFTFSTPVDIDPSTDYWGIIDTTSVSGTVHAYGSAAAATAKHAYNDGSWNTENDKYLLHDARSSLPSQRVAEDIVRMYKDPHERIVIIAPAAPHLQVKDEVVVDITVPFTVSGRYVIEDRDHKLTSDGYVTIDRLRQTSG